MSIQDTNTVTPDTDFDAEAAEGLSDEGYVAAEEAAAVAGGRDAEFDTDAAAGLSDQDYHPGA
ncbi:hypothetical protein [Arthrobacter sp. ES1]|uniref:hypothetical protein n=1 Tax=Arthrobacter sp. ES1 TaxID=1897056 RepID=UPI001CFFBE29|nr:hypothetical protein [Arthrobacter sp. ES1]